MQPSNRLPTTHHQRRKEQGSDPTGRAVGKGRLPTVFGPGAALVIFALAFFAAATPAFAQEESTMLGATAMQLTGGSPELSSGDSTMEPPQQTTQMTETTAEPPVQSPRPTTSYPSTLPSTTAMTTTSQPSATVPSNTTMPAAVQSQYSNPTPTGSLANTGGISLIALVVGILVVLIATLLLVRWRERRSEEAANE